MLGRPHSELRAKRPLPMASPRVAATVAVFAGRLRRRRSEAHGATQHESEQLHAGLDDDSLELPVRRLPSRALRPALPA